MNLYIKVGSITNAQRGMRALKKHGYKPTIKKIDNPSPGDGCGYVLVVKASDDAPIDILSKERINIKGVDSR